MKNHFLVAMLLLSYCSYSQVQPYVDVSAVCDVLPFTGKVGIDAGINYEHISLELNGLFIGKTRLGGTIGYQINERGSEWPGMRIYGGLMGGKYNTAHKDLEEIYQHQWQPVAGAKITHASLVFGGMVIMSKQPEIFISCGFQIVEIIKWATR